MVNIEFNIYDQLHDEYVPWFQYVALSETWCNFLDYVHLYSDDTRWNHPDHHYAMNYCETRVNEELKQYEASYNAQKNAIIFLNESKYTWFMVKYGQ